jgi:hypothetical protein
MKRILFILIIGLQQTHYCIAKSSTNLVPPAGLIPHSLQSYVDTKTCTKPIKSLPYVIVAGNGGANMNLTCPPTHPVMYGWRQEVGFGGLLAVQAGGGASWIVCCAVGHKWAPIPS